MKRKTQSPMTSHSKCEHPFCRNKRAQKNRFCHKHHKQRWRANNPIKAAFGAFRDNAIRRGKEFKISFAEFLEFCVKHDYLKLKGQTPVSLTIDRRDNDKGYTIDNMQTLTLSENARKGNKSIRECYARGWLDQNGRPIV